MKPKYPLEFDESRIYDDLDEIARKIEFFYGNPEIGEFVNQFDKLVTIWRKLGYEKEE